MTENVLRARSVTELVDAAVQLLRQHYMSIIIVSGIGMAPGLILQPVLTNLMSDMRNGPSLSSFAVTIALAMFSWVWYSLAGAAIIVAASQGYIDGHIDIPSAFDRVRGRIGAVLYSSMYKGLAIGLGFILLFVGSIYYYATYFAVPTTVVVEGLDGSAGVNRSRELANGNRWRVLGPTALVYCIYLLIIGGILLLGEMAFGANATTLQGILGVIARILIYPIVPITELLVYYDLRIRVEGYDVEVMASKLDASVAPPAA